MRGSMVKHDLVFDIYPSTKIKKFCFGNLHRSLFANGFLAKRQSKTSNI